MQNKIYIEVPKESERLNYVLNWLFIYRLGLEVFFKVNQDVSGFLISVEPNSGTEKSIKLCGNSGILYENTLEKERYFQMKNTFEKRYINTDFDILGAIFFCLSRYEEYFGFPLDKHKRFVPENSILLENEIIFPWADEIVFNIKRKLTEAFPLLVLANQKIENTLTIDLDVGLLYAGKGLFRSLGGLLKDLFSLKYKQALSRIFCWVQPTKDPLFEVVQNTNASVVFAPLWRGSKFDRNLKINSIAYQNLLLAWHTKGVEVGLHPSYNSGFNKFLLPFEVKLFEQLGIGKVFFSRQHFLRFKPEATFIALEKLGIEKDFSMGYSTILGYRAGTGYSFQHFNFEKNEAVNIIHEPFALMDNALIPFVKEDLLVKDKLSKLKEISKKFNSPVTVVWHDWTMVGVGPGKDIFKIYPLVKNIFGL